MNIKGRPRGGIVMGIRKELIEKGIKIEKVIEGMMEGRARCGKERWRVDRGVCKRGYRKEIRRVRERGGG